MTSGLLLVLTARAARPTLSGPEELVADDAFAVHYTRSGADAVPPLDADTDGTLDLPQRVLAALDLAASAYAADGWRPVVPDEGGGDTPQIDVYLRVLDINGYAHPVTTASGATCWLEVDPTLGLGGQLIESVTAHELHHCVQYAYTPDADAWIYEATATGAQYGVVTDGVLDLGLGVLWSNRLAHPERSVDDTGDRYEYAGFVWTKFWSELDGADPSRLPDLWEALAQTPRDWEAAHDAEAQRLWGRTLPEVFVRHAEWNRFACAADDGAHYAASPLGCAVDAEVPHPLGQDIGSPEPRAAWSIAYTDRASGDDPGPVTVRCAEGLDQGLALMAVDAQGALAEATYGTATADTPLEVALSANPPAGGTVRIAHTVGATPADTVDCTLEEAPPLDPPAPRGCASAPGPSPGPLAPLILLALRRLRRVRVRAPAAPR